LSAQVPASTRTGETIQVSAQAVSDDSPVVAYHWDFGDDTSADGARASHTYTRASNYRVRLSGKGVDGLGTELEFPVNVTGALNGFPDLSTNRREADATQ
jgi:alpha-galactosidase